MTLFMVPSMYLIAERLRRPMRRMYGGKWISFLGIPPFTPIFLYLVMINLQLKPMQRFYKIFPRNLLFALAMAPLALLLFLFLNSLYSSPAIMALVMLSGVISVIVILLIVIRQIIRLFARLFTGKWI
jgi:hypothetical protein